MNILLLDPVGGASGNMILAGLIQLGCPVKHVQDAIEKLGLGKPVIDLKVKKINAINCLHLEFCIKDEEHERSWSQVKKIIEQSDISEPVKKRALEIFQILAEAEAHVHGVNVDDVHFHEVGALDSIFDIVGIAAAVDFFAPEAVFTTPLPLSTGTVNSRHGILPVPAPATLKLLEGLPLRSSGIEGELITPTGAAVIKTIAKAVPDNDFIINGSGYGCGSKVFPNWPNMFRTMLCQSRDDSEGLYILESDIDDMSPEDFHPAIERIKESGAIDVMLINCIMKHGRPGVLLRAIVSYEKLDNATGAILEHTSTIGVRYYKIQRRILERREFLLETGYGKVKIKEVASPAGNQRCKPEYRDIAEISGLTGLPVNRIRELVNAKLALTKHGAGE